jgi:outer membrane lipoprotein LolB
MTPARLAAAATLAALALSGCASLPSVGSDGLSYDDRRTRLEAVSAWEMRGRIAVETADGGGQARFYWLQNGDALELVVRGPFGGGVLRVSGTPRELTVTSRGDTRVLDDPETQLSEVVGWWLPVTSLHAWLLGFPDRQFPAEADVGPEGTLRALDQRLWRLDYATYQLGSDQLGAAPAADGASVLVPRRIDLAHGDLRVRLTIDDWNPNPAP